MVILGASPSGRAVSLAASGLAPSLVKVTWGYCLLLFSRSCDFSFGAMKGCHQKILERPRPNTQKHADHQKSEILMKVRTGHFLAGYFNQSETYQADAKKTQTP